MFQKMKSDFGFWLSFGAARDATVHVKLCSKRPRDNDSDVTTAETAGAWERHAHSSGVKNERIDVNIYFGVIIFTNSS